MKQQLAECSCAIEIPLLPASVNHYTLHKATGVHVKSPEAKGFEQSFGIFVRGAHAVSRTPAFTVAMQIVLPMGKRGDVDNFPKQLLDCAAKAGMFRSSNGLELADSYVHRLEVELYRDNESRQRFGPLVRLSVMPFNPATWAQVKERKPWNDLPRQD